MNDETQRWEEWGAAEGNAGTEGGAEPVHASADAEANEATRLRTDGGFSELDPRVRTQWILEGLFQAVILGAVAFALDWFWLAKTDWWVLPLWGLTGGVGGASALLALIYPRYAYRAWSFAIRSHDVLLHFGVVWRVRRSVPRSRIQHVDIRSGPVDRAFGLVKVTIFTAGSGEADATVPGLTQKDAERLRETLLGEDRVD